MKKVVGISLIFISFLGFVSIKFYTCFESMYHKKEIENIFINGVSNYTKYIGYIYIEKIGLKRGIVSGINDSILNDLDIGMLRNDNIILAGHDISTVFGNLKKLNINDRIELFLNETTNYVVIKKVIVEKNDFSYLNSDLVLITCTNDGKRLLILAKKDI